MIQYDVTDLQIGDCIDANECERLLEMSSQNKDYAMKIMTLAKQIERDLWKLGKQYTVRTQNGSIRVLTHAEASEYNARLDQSANRKKRLAHRRGLAVDTSGFTEDLRKTHFDNLAKQGRILSAMRQRANLELTPTVKSTPIRSVPSSANS